MSVASRSAGVLLAGALLFATLACGRDSDTSVRAADVRATKTPVTQKQSSAAAPAADEKPTAAPGGSEPAQGSPSEASATETEEEPLPLVISVDPSCATGGRAVTATINTVSKADLALVAAYANGQTYGAYAIEQADDKGVFAWRFTVPAAAPAGDAHVYVAAQESEPTGKRARQARAETSFRVAGPTGC